MARLIAFYSRAGENYFGGQYRTVTVGNTEKVANQIAEAIGGTLFPIRQKVPYAVAYETCIRQAKADQQANARPELADLPGSLDGYEEIYLGYPNYWGDLPMAVYTFLEAFDWTGKIIHPFCTHEGSGLSGTEKKIAAVCKGARVTPGLAIRGSDVDTAGGTVRAWAQKTCGERKSSVKNVMIWTGAGQIGMAIARRMGYGMKIVVGDKTWEHARAIARTMNDAGYDVVPVEMDLSSRASIRELIAEAQRYGAITMLVNAAGVSPSQAPIEAILKVDLYGTAVLLEEVGKVIAPGGVGVTISSQSGHRMPALTPGQDAQLACTPAEELLALPILRPENIRDTLHAYQLAKRCNEKRVMAESVRWGARGARINSISPGIIVTPLAIDEFNGPRGNFYKNMFAKCPAGRPGTADEVANVAELLMGAKGAFITGADFLIDGGATASYFYGPPKPQA